MNAASRERIRVAIEILRSVYGLEMSNLNLARDHVGTTDLTYATDVLEPLIENTEHLNDALTALEKIT